MSERLSNQKPVLKEIIFVIIVVALFSILTFYLQYEDAKLKENIIYCEQFHGYMDDGNCWIPVNQHETKLLNYHDEFLLTGQISGMRCENGLVKHYVNEFMWNGKNYEC